MGPEPVFPEDDEGSSERPAVLLVEDDAELRAYLRKHLARDYQVLEAGRGDEGLELARSRTPDVVVSDVIMPGLDGFDLCRAIKSDPETDFIPVILLTTRSDTPSRIAGLEEGADDYVAKPFDPAELLLRIRNIVQSRARLSARVRIEAGDRPSFEPSPLPLDDAGAAFRQRMLKILDAESQDVSFDVRALAGALGLSRTHLHRRVKQAFGLTPSELLVGFRLERAARMLVRHTGSVGEVAYAVGFRDLSHFVRRFRDRYGQTPGVYAATHPRPTVEPSDPQAQS